MADRCTGHCCRSFHLGLSMDDLKARVGKGNADDDFVADMVIPLGFIRTPHKVNKYARRHEPESKFMSAMGYYYTCRHYVDGNCTVYEKRPDMCRRYPNDKPCVYLGCELTPELVPDVPVRRLVRYQKIDVRDDSTTVVVELPKETT